MGEGAEEAISHAKPVLFIAGDIKSFKKSAAYYKCGGHCLCVGVPALAHEPMVADPCLKEYKIGA